MLWDTKIKMKNNWMHFLNSRKTIYRAISVQIFLFYSLKEMQKEATYIILTSKQKYSIDQLYCMFYVITRIQCRKWYSI